MKDPEFIQLRNKFFISVLVIIAFMIPIFFILKNKFMDHDTNLLKELKKNSSIVILVTENKCSDCKKVEKKLTKSNVNHYILNKDTSSDYNKILKKLNITEKDITFPSIVYVQEGNVISILVTTDENEIKEFIKNYNLSN